MTANFPAMAPEPVLRAALSTLHLGLSHLRNRARSGEPLSVEEVHSLTEALHQVPATLCDWRKWSLDEVKTFLGRHEPALWGSTHLVDLFEHKLADQMAAHFES